MKAAIVALGSIAFAAGCATTGDDVPALERAGAGGEPTRSPSTTVETSRASFSSCRDHLDAIADCFHKVVTVTQREPALDDSMARLLGEATWTIAAGDVHAACTRLGLTPTSERLTLDDGSLVRVEKREVSRDEFEGGITTWTIRYRFSSSTCDHVGEAELELIVGAAN